MSLDLGMEDDPPPPQPAIIPPNRQDAPRVEAPPEDELLLVSACMGDMDGALFRQASHLPDSAFTNHECRRIWAAMRAGSDRKPGVGRIIAWPQRQTSMRVIASARSGCRAIRSSAMIVCHCASVRFCITWRACAGGIADSGMYQVSTVGPSLSLLV